MNLICPRTERVTSPMHGCRHTHDAKLLLPEGVLHLRPPNRKTNTKKATKGNVLCTLVSPSIDTPHTLHYTVLHYTPHNCLLYVPDASQNMDEKSVTALTFQPLISALNFSLNPKTLRKEVTFLKSQLPMGPCSRETPSGSFCHFWIRDCKLEFCKAHGVLPLGLLAWPSCTSSKTATAGNGILLYEVMMNEW